MTISKSVIVAAAMFSLASVNAFAQEKCPAEKLVIGTGTTSGTYAQLFRSLADVCPSVCEDRATQGGADNLQKILNKKFDGGIVQVDMLEFMSRNDPNVRRNIRSLLPLHTSSLHVFALRDGWKTVRTESAWGGLKSKEVVDYKPISNFQDLKGLPVAAWSSALITANIVSDRLRLDMDIIKVDTRAEGLKMLKEGKVAAFMGMGGLPVDWVEGSVGGSKSEIDRSMVMVNVSSDNLTTLGSPYINAKATYPSINAYGVNTVTVRNEVVVWNIAGGKRAAAVGEFKACFMQNVQDIKDSRDSHPAWAEVERDAPLAWEAYKTNEPFVGPVRR